MKKSAFPNILAQAQIPPSPDECSYRKEDPLVKPTFPQADKNGIIDVSQLTQIQFVVPYYKTPVPEDIITGYFGQQQVGTFQITDTNWNKPPFVIEADPSKIPNGYYNAWYTVRTDIGNCSRSDVAEITITGSTANVLPAPVFPDAFDDIWPSTQIASTGARIWARYPSITQYDVITFVVTGYAPSGERLQDADWSDGGSVQVDDVTNGYFEKTIPYDKIQILGEMGYYKAYYTMVRSQSTESSLTSVVYLTLQDITLLQIVVTARAPQSDLASFNAKNTALIYGRPGAKVECFAENGTINNIGTDATVQINRYGLASFDIYTPDSNEVPISIESRDMGNQDPPDPLPALFDTNALAGNGTVIIGFNNTTNIPVGPSVPGTIYIQCDKQYAGKYVNVHIKDSLTALIDNWSNADVQALIGTDGTVTVVIYDTVPETVTIELSAPPVDGAITPVQITWVAFPIYANPEGPKLDRA